MIQDCYSNEELQILLKDVGKNVQIDRSVRLLNSKNISIGSNVRIDSFAILSAGNYPITIGNNVHIAAFCQLAASGEEIILNDFCAISSRVNIFTATDDYINGYLTNPTVPDKYKKIKCGKVILEKHVLIGAGTIILPDVTIGFGSTVGALSLVSKNLESGIVAAGVPAKMIKNRDLLRLKKLEEEYLNEKYS